MKFPNLESLYPKLKEHLKNSKWENKKWRKNSYKSNYNLR